nr:HalOD1 output domain-containing protein [Halorubrum aquaticum]
MVEIVETLEACGLEYDAYQLHEYVDVEALDKLIASPDGNVTVKFTVEGIRLSVSAEGVDILVEE